MHKYKCIIFWTPKCGHSTMYEYLCQIYKTRDINKNQTHNNGNISHHEKWKEYTLILIYRNPFSRCVSSFRQPNLFQRNLTFNEFLEVYPSLTDHHCNIQATGQGLQLYNILNRTYNRTFDYKLETSELDNLKPILEKICDISLEYRISNIRNERIDDKIEIDNTENKLSDIPVKQIGKVKDYRSFYTKTNYKKAYKLFVKDLEFFTRIGIEIPLPI